ncbi:hypothetical protein K402DRAFT_408339 [Aulographum hederae CBS 113979]|uniref:DNA-binding protein RAP1 n=1 Tax=Aulographum hederae CBS 113979 TaxID=1176131 RepID=A0A6G1GL57_9PEZI|nr:hypothetical protein K402DRAFT_408339 [Aulographum hederae CBS 113979]
MAEPHHAPIIYTDVAEDADIHGDLFAGIKFFLARTVPQRRRFVEKVENNGGTVVPLETQADFRIFDHKRKGSPAGSLSFTFITASLQDGEIAEADDHLAGPPAGSVRAVGSTSLPAKKGRTDFTAEDDQLLYKYVMDCAVKGLPTKGNVIYTPFAAENPRHTMQSWRDRYVSHLADKPPKGLENYVPNVTSKALPHRQAEHPNADKIKSSPEAVRGQDSERGKGKANVPIEDADFDDEDFHDLIASAEDILVMPLANFDAAWRQWAGRDARPISAKKWEQFFRDEARPIYDELNRYRGWQPIYTKAWEAWDETHIERGPWQDWAEYIKTDIIPVLERSRVSNGSKNKRALQDRPTASFEGVEEPASSKRRRVETQPRQAQEVSSKLASPVGTSNGAVNGNSVKARSHAALDTHETIAEDSQDVDVDVPEPEDGPEADVEEDDEEVGEGSVEEEPEAVPHIGDLQEIDKDGNEADISSELGRRQDVGDSNGMEEPEDLTNGEETEEQSQSDRLTLMDEVEALIKDGYKADHVIAAVKATSANMKLAIKVLDILEEQGHLPDDRRGVWTDRDDEALKAGTKMGLRRLAEKHGREGPAGIEGRREFWKSWDEDQEDSQE